jgi:hypothetical protein
MQFSDFSKFLKKHWKTIALLNLLPIGLVMWFRLTDPHIDEVREYLLSQSEVCTNLGDIEKLSLRRSIISMKKGDYGQAKEPDRIKYTFVATGSKGRETIRVNVQISETDQVGGIDVEC